MHRRPHALFAAPVSPTQGSMQDVQVEDAKTRAVLPSAAWPTAFAEHLPGGGLPHAVTQALLLTHLLTQRPHAAEPAPDGAVLLAMAPSCAGEQDAGRAVVRHFCWQVLSAVVFAALSREQTAWHPKHQRLTPVEFPVASCVTSATLHGPA
jgi:hypothetical protein